MNEKNGIGESKPKQSRRQEESMPELPVGHAYAVEQLAVSKVLTFCLRTPFKFFAMTQLKIEIRNVENMYNWNTRQLLINNLKIYREEIRYEQIRVLNIFYSHSGDLADRRRSADRRLKTADLVRKIDVTLVQW